MFVGSILECDISVEFYDFKKSRYGKWCFKKHDKHQNVWVSIFAHQYKFQENKVG